MRLILLILVFYSLAFSQDFLIRRTGTAGCTTPSSHTYDQGFETAFPITGHTQSGTITSGASLTGSPPVASCSLGLTFASGTSPTASPYNRYDHGSTMAAWYFRIDIKRVGGYTTAWKSLPVYVATEASGAYNSQQIFAIYIERFGGSNVDIHANGTTLVSSSANDTWYRITGYVEQATPSNSWIKINGGSSIPFTPAGGSTYAARYIWFGSGTTADLPDTTIQVGYFAISTTGEISGNDVSNP